MRIMRDIILGISFGVSIAFLSWIVGMIVNLILMKTRFYSKLSNLNFITSEKINRKIGIKNIKWVIENTFFKFFNQKIKIKNSKTDFFEIREEMTRAEISHLMAFIFVLFFCFYYSLKINIVFGSMIFIINILMNLYPSLLQQQNKRRIDKFTKRHLLRE